MRDLNFTLRNSLGQVKFGVEANNTPISEVEVFRNYISEKLQLLTTSSKPAALTVPKFSL